MEQKHGNKFLKGQKAYIVENNCKVTPVLIKKVNGCFFVVQREGHDEGFQLKKHRLFETEEAARMTIVADETITGRNSWYYNRVCK